MDLSELLLRRLSFMANKMLKSLSNGGNRAISRRRSTGQILTSTIGAGKSKPDGIEETIMESEERGNINDDYQDLSPTGSPIWTRLVKKLSEKTSGSKLER